MIPVHVFVQTRTSFELLARKPLLGKLERNLHPTKQMKMMLRKLLSFWGNNFSGAMWKIDSGTVGFYHRKIFLEQAQHQCPKHQLIHKKLTTTPKGNLKSNKALVYKLGQRQIPGWCFIDAAGTGRIHTKANLRIPPLRQHALLRLTEHRHKMSWKSRTVQTSPMFLSQLDCGGMVAEWLNDLTGAAVFHPKKPSDVEGGRDIINHCDQPKAGCLEIAVRNQLLEVPMMLRIRDVQCK